jgi:UDP-N-acetylmuramoyl-tripeptide--D-alanyl-D-alanine ligase
VHIEFFKSKEHLVEEKSGLIKTLKKDGVLILNVDDPVVMGMQTKTKNKIFTYGFNTEADLIVSNMTLSYSENKKPEGVTFTVQRKGGDIVSVVMQGRFGKNHMYSTLAALAVSCSLDWNMYEAIRELKNYEVPRGRMCLIPGVKGSIIIDDTYNSSPVAAEAALETLKEVSGNGRKIVALGDMLELGEDSEEAHRSIGKIAKDSCNFLITVGEMAKFIKAGAIEAGMHIENIFEFSNSKEAGDFLRDFIKTGDIILVKGSQGIRMERVVAAILQDIDMKGNLLVRQEKEWLDKK